MKKVPQIFFYLGDLLYIALIRLIRKNIIRVIGPLFADCNSRMITISAYDVKVFVWYQYQEGALKDLLKILKVIDDTDLILSPFEVWRDVGYYDDTDDITLNFVINKELLKKL